jgi:hypothetical protein
MQFWLAFSTLAAFATLVQGECPHDAHKCYEVLSEGSCGANVDCRWDVSCYYYEETEFEC